MNNLTSEEQYLIETFNRLSSGARRIILDVLRLMHKSEANRNDLPRN